MPELKRCSYKLVSRKYKFCDNDKLYFISFALVNWIDLFIREGYKETNDTAAVTACAAPGYELKRFRMNIYWGWCIIKVLMRFCTSATGLSSTK